MQWGVPFFFLYLIDNYTTFVRPLYQYMHFWIIGWGSAVILGKIKMFRFPIWHDYYSVIFYWQVIEVPRRHKMLAMN